MAGVLLAACSSDATGRPPAAEPPADPALDPAPEPEPSATEVASATVTETIDAGHVHTLAKSACKIATVGRAEADAGVRLFASKLDARDDVPLVEARYESATFHLSEGKASETVSRAEASGWGTALAALIKTRDVPIWVKSSRKIANGMMMSGPKSSFRLVRVEGDSAVVRFTFGKTAIEESVPCDDLIASPPTMAPRANGKEMQLDASRGVEVLPTPTSKPGSGIVVRTPKSAQPVFFDIVEIERKGKFANVQIPSMDGTITGWVPVGNVRPFRQEEKEQYGVIGLLSGGDSGGASRRDDLPRGDRLVGCPGPLKVAAIPRLKTGPVWIGEVRAKTAIGLVEPSRQVGVPQEVPPPKGWVEVKLAAVQSRVLARKSDLNPCDGW